MKLILTILFFFIASSVCAQRDTMTWFRISPDTIAVCMQSKTDGAVLMTIFDQYGKVAIRPIKGYKYENEYVTMINVGNLTDGVYELQVTINGSVLLQKPILILKRKK